MLQSGWNIGAVFLLGFFFNTQQLFFPSSDRLVFSDFLQYSGTCMLI